MDTSRLKLAKHLQDCCRCGILVLDSSGRVVSSDLEIFLGPASGKQVYQTLADLPDPVPKLAEQALRTGAPADGHVTWPTPGEHRSVRVRVAPFQIGAERGLVLVFAELAGAAEFEQKLQRLDRLASVGTLSAGLAHEMRNALVAIRTFIDLLLEKNQDAELAEVVLRELVRIDLLAARVLRFAGPAKPAFAPVHLNEVLDHSVRLVQHQFKAKGITVQRSYQAEPGLVQGDDRQLEQIFVNLLLNSLEALNGEGTISISTARVAGEPGSRSAGAAPQICVVIQDNGAGIAPEHLGHLFEPFFTTKSEGTGLGLAMTRRLIREHGGQISIESHLDQGTTVRLLFPVLGPEQLSDGAD